MKQHIYIIGAGAIGKALAVFLANAGREVTLIRGSINNGADEVTPIEVTMNDEKHVATIRLSTISNTRFADGLIIVATKSNGNEVLAEKLLSLAGMLPVIVMQNGLDVEDPFVKQGLKNVYRCVLLATSQYTGDNLLRFKPVSASAIGWVHGDTALLPGIIELLNTPLFPFQAVSDIKPFVWKKVIANCVFNSICPLLEVDNGIFYRNENARALASEVIIECVSIASESGISLDVNDVLETVMRISLASEGQLISTLQDIRNKRPTEINSLNFAIVREAIAADKPDVVVKTRLLGELTRLKSDLALPGNAFSTDKDRAQ